MNSRSNVRRWLPYSVLAVAIIVTLIATYYVRASIQTRDRLRLLNHISITQQAVSEKIDAQVGLLRAGAAFISASDAVSREDFRVFIEGLDLANHYPGVQGVGFSLRIPRGREDSLVRAMRGEGLENFRLTSDSSDAADERHAIIFLEPHDERNLRAVGFDMYSDPVRRAAMILARDSAAPAISRKVRLRQEIDSNVQAGFLIYVPVYSGTLAPTGVEERRQKLRGFVYSPLRADDLFRGVADRGAQPRVDVRVYDGPDPATSNLLHDSRSEHEGGDDEPLHVDTVGVVVPEGRWSLVVSTRPSFEVISGKEQVPLVLVAGLILSGVLFFITRAEAIAREDAERNALSLARSEEALRASEGRFRTIFNQAAVGIAEIDLDGCLIMVNKRFSEILGYSPEELIGCTYPDLTYPDDLDVSMDYVARLRSTGEPFGLKKRYLHKSGRIVWANVSASLLRDGAGNPSKIAAIIEDITAREEAAEALRESELRLRRLVESNIFGVASGDYGGAITYANDYFLEMLGYDRADLETGSIRWDGLAAPSHRDVLRMATAQLARGGVVNPIETEFVRRDGQTVPTLIGSALLAETLTSGSRVIAFCLDLTERRRVDQELRSAKETAEAANRAKDRFLAVLSHELRTPLTPVMAAIEAFDTSELSDDLQMIFDIVQRNIALESRLIDDLLDLTRIANGKLQLFVEPVDVHQLIRQTIEMVEEIPAKRLSVSARLEAKSYVVDADAARLQQVVWNLVRNAARYTHAGGTIEIGTRISDGRLVIAVRDDGVGIDPQELDRIFNAFEQGSNRSPQHGGLGLGLAISRMLVEMHGGTIRAASEGKGKGAEFTVELPVVTDAKAKEIAPLPVHSQTSAEGARVLLVDDHGDTRNVLELLLRQFGYQVITAESVETAITAAQEPFDVLVSDIGLPDGTGYDLLAYLRQRGETRAIALSGYGMEDDLARSRAAGFAQHLTKPIDIRRLHEAIEHLIETTTDGARS
jgi:PAS domain S-box-containing protein